MPETVRWSVVTPKERSDAVRALRLALSTTGFASRQGYGVTWLQLGDDWRGTDKETDYPELMARNLLLEFVGGDSVVIRS